MGRLDKQPVNHYRVLMVKPRRKSPRHLPKLPGVTLTFQEKRLLADILARKTITMREDLRQEMLAHIVAKVEQAGASAVSALLSRLGLDMVSTGLALRDCRDNAVRAGATVSTDKETGEALRREIPDHQTRHAASRTILEWQRQIGPRRDLKTKATVQAPSGRSGRQADKILGDVPTPADDAPAEDVKQ
jgi:hypothetical protein